MSARLYERVPQIWLWALVPAVAGFVVSVELTSSTTTNGVRTGCAALDVAAIAASALLMVMTVVGLARARHERDPALPPPRWLTAVVAAVYFSLTVRHLLHGLGLLGVTCG